MSAVEGADTTAALRARIDEIHGDVTGAWDSDVFDALRAVLDLCDEVASDAEDVFGDGNPRAGVWDVDILRAIAAHIGGTP